MWFLLILIYFILCMIFSMFPAKNVFSSLSWTDALRSLCSIFRIVSEALFKCGHLTKQFLIPCGFFLDEGYQQFYSKHKGVFTSHFSSLRLQVGMAFLLHFVLGNSEEILSPYRNEIRVACTYNDSLYPQVFK